MNLKYQFYKCYYEGLDARQLLGNNEDANVNIFEDINKAIVNVQFHPGASKSTIAGYRDYVSKLAGANRLYLKTTYPGLLIGSGYTHETGTLGEFKLGFLL